LVQASFMSFRLRPCTGWTPAAAYAAAAPAASSISLGQQLQRSIPRPIGRPPPARHQIRAPLVIALAALVRIKSATGGLPGLGQCRNHLVARMASSSSQPLAFDAGRRQVFVVGNEAADADSLVSAYAMAMLLNSDEVQAIAIAQIPREEFRLRGDALALFQQSGSEVRADGTPVQLHFWDEVDWASADAIQSRSIVLTDHNKMSDSVADHFAGRVEWVLDHHQASGSYPDVRIDLDEGLGSTCTLVAEQWLKKGILPQEIGVMLAGVILLDTRNLCPKEMKGTPRDKAALDALVTFLPEQGAGSWYAQLMDARRNVSHLNVREHLLLDMKVVSINGLVVAVSSIMATMPELFEKAGGPKGFEEEVRRLAACRGYQAVVGLFSKDESKRKGLAVVPVEDAESGPHAELCRQLVQRLQGVPGNLPPALKENPLFETQGLLAERGFDLQPLEDMKPLVAFSINGAVSRKTLLPSAMNASSL